LHPGQMSRIRRWAVIIRVVEAVRKGSMPMLLSRVMAPGASLVCNVENRRCPVRAPLMAISAVSLSRISPTSMMLGSCRRNARSPAAKLSPISGRAWTWLMPSMRYSIGSSMVMMFLSGRLSMESVE